MTVGRIAIDKLKPHPKNGYYFSDVEGEKYEEIKRSIATYGIRDPLKVSTDYVVISGHQRLRIAKELGMTSVPVEIVDPNESEDVKSGRVTPEQYIEYLLIAENVERRGQAETDPMKKARIVQFLKEFWGVRDGSAGRRSLAGQNALQKTIADISEMVSESERTTKRFLKLNDLIPELQQLVSDGKLGTTAAEQLAYLTEDEQRSLYEAIGESVARLTVAEAGELKQEARKARESGDDFKEVIERLKREKEEAEQRALFAERRLKEMAAQAPKVREVVKEVVPPEVERKLKSMEQRLNDVEQERDKLDAELSKAYLRLSELERLEKSVKHERQVPMYDMYRSAAVLEGRLQMFIEDIRLAKALVANCETEIVDKVNNVLGRIISLAEQTRGVINDVMRKNVVDVEVIEIKPMKNATNQ